MVTGRIFRDRLFFARKKKTSVFLVRGPVMNELVNHPDWMPLLLDDNGEVHLKRKGVAEDNSDRGYIR